MFWVKLMFAWFHNWAAQSRMPFITHISFNYEHLFENWLNHLLNSEMVHAQSREYFSFLVGILHYYAEHLCLAIVEVHMSFVSTGFHQCLAASALTFILKNAVLVPCIQSDLSETWTHSSLKTLMICIFVICESPF